MAAVRPDLMLGDLTVVVPTYKEASNIPYLLKRLEGIRAHFQGFEVLIVDDNSRDGTDEAIHKLNLNWVRLIVRTTQRGLSPSVIDGIRAAQFSQICVMDADLSHPAEAIPRMLETLQREKSDFVIGSRYCEGGKIDQAWSLLRYINSWVATMMARPFTKAKDPMSGFFAFHKNLFLNAKDLNPIGYKIGLELIVKGGAKNIHEVPIVFVDREHGESKLTLKEQINYVRHLKRLLDYKFGNISFFLQFGFSGTLGLAANILHLKLFLFFQIPLQVSVALAILFSMGVTFLSNRFITFNHGMHAPWIPQLLAFVMASTVGAVVNWYITILSVQNLGASHVAAVILGVLAGMTFNFIFSRYLIFRSSIQKKTKT